MRPGQYAIVGVGQSAVGEVQGSTSLGLLAAAMKNAIADAGVDKADVDGLISRGPDDVYCHHQRVGQVLGLDVRFSTTLDSGGASQCLGVATACMAIEAGLCSTVVCGFGRNTWSRTRSPEARMRVSLVPDAQRPAEFGPEFGLIGATAVHALGARRHMHEYGTTKEQLGAVATAFREHASRNPLAQRQTPLSIDEYLASRRVVEPLSVHDCSLLTDGAGAVVVTSSERAAALGARYVDVLGFGSASNLRGWLADDHAVSTAARESGRTAFRMAGLGPEDIDVVQLYDCFTYMVLVQLEDYGFCDKGDGGAFVAGGALALDGALPANTSGGQLSEGHVEGMLQIVEAVRQLRDDHPPERRVGAETALVSGHGGNAACHSTLILGRGPQS